MTKEQRAGRVPGIIVGILFIFVWILLIVHIEASTVAFHQNVYDNPLLFWITLGPVPLLIIAGMYCFSREGWTDAKRKQEFAGIKGMLAGYVIGIVALLIWPPPGNDTIYPAVGGYLLMLVLALAFQGKFQVQDT